MTNTLSSPTSAMHEWVWHTFMLLSETFLPVDVHVIYVPEVVLLVTLVILATYPMKIKVKKQNEA